MNKSSKVGDRVRFGKSRSETASRELTEMEKDFDQGFSCCLCNGEPISYWEYLSFINKTTWVYHSFLRVPWLKMEI